MIARMVIVIACHGVEDHACEQFDAVFDRCAHALEFFGQPGIAPARPFRWPSRIFRGQHRRAADRHHSLLGLPVEAQHAHDAQAVAKPVMHRTCEIQA